eukprot:1298337-Pyramimonas_sp.AAC.1
MKRAWRSRPRLARRLHVQHRLSKEGRQLGPASVTSTACMTRPLSEPVVTCCDWSPLPLPLSSPPLAGFPL